ncbi:SURF1 family protein [Xinfangfangia pollutisoli]|uniref:SURF1 family protein n=1 Tax=Xinfangfangia pollutisoli TaxID=2865960 RepID=UPI001CD6AAED|nr:SURF1 family protein [Xinfangfangia pollutisoli]
MRNLLFALVVGLAGTGTLLALGNWQMQRLAWKEALIAEAEAMMDDPPVALPDRLDPARDRYRPVQVAGRFTGEEADVLASDVAGPGFRILAAFQTDGGRRILIDRGFVPEDRRADPRPAKPAEVTGNLVWPDDLTSSTPPHDAKTGMWFARDLPGIAAALGTEPVLIVARSETGDGVAAVPASAAFRNDHLQYAITWFLLAAVWAGMTGAYLWRIRQRKA